MTGMLRLLKSGDANAIGRHGDVPPDSLAKDWTGVSPIALIVTIAAVLVPAELLARPTMIAATCAALLIGGLPHGALDLAVLRRDAHHHIALAISLYLGLAAIMFAAWQVAPVLALGLFLVMAMVHFAEDWSAAEHPFFALGIAVALLSAPALLQREAVGELFVLLTAEQDASGLADGMLLVAPTAAACALLAILLLWQSGHRATAFNAVCALAALILLPPITGFAIYFCLIHSPTHFRAGLERLAPATGVTRPTIVATLGGLTIAVATLLYLPITDTSNRFFAASFMTLSILTLPHMAVPFLLRHLCLSAHVLPQRI